MIELSWRGSKTVDIGNNGLTRKFIQDGDEVCAFLLVPVILIRFNCTAIVRVRVTASASENASLFFFQRCNSSPRSVGDFY
jgi:hypothetical protein